MLSYGKCISCTEKHEKVHEWTTILFGAGLANELSQDEQAFKGSSTTLGARRQPPSSGLDRTGATRSFTIMTYRKLIFYVLLLQKHSVKEAIKRF